MEQFIEEKNRIFLNNITGNMVAEITFPNIDEDTVNINHTFVDDSLRGQGIASKLVEATARLLQKKQKKAIVTCSYAIQWFEKHEEYRELIK